MLRWTGRAVKSRSTEAGREHPQVCSFCKVRNHLGVERDDVFCVQRAEGAGRRGAQPC